MTAGIYKVTDNITLSISPLGADNRVIGVFGRKQPTFHNQRNVEHESIVVLRDENNLIRSSTLEGFNPLVLIQGSRIDLSSIQLHRVEDVRILVSQTPFSAYTR